MDNQSPSFPTVCSLDHSLTLELQSGCSWEDCYQRSCRSGGLKLLKCFPTCRGLHLPGSMMRCCDPVLARLVTTPRDPRRSPEEAATGRFVCVAYFQLAGGKPLDSPAPWANVEALRQTKAAPLNPYLIAEYGEADDPTASSVLFRLRPSGWHYGFKSGRGKERLEHQLRVAALRLAENEDGLLVATLVATAASQSFRLMSTRQASASPSALLPLHQYHRLYQDVFSLFFKEELLV